MTERQRGNGPGPAAIIAGQTMRTLRVIRRITQEELSERTRRLGRQIPKTRIGRIEQGISFLDIDDLLVVAEALGATLQELVQPVALEEVVTRIRQHPESATLSEAMLIENRMGMTIQEIIGAKRG